MEAHLVVLVELGCPPVGPGGFERPTQRSRRPTHGSERCWEAHPKVREESIGPPKGLREFGRPTRTFERG